MGSFTDMQENDFVPDIRELVLEFLRDREIPVVKIDNIGHAPNAKCIVIGKSIHFKKQCKWKINVLNNIASQFKKMSYDKYEQKLSRGLYFDTLQYK